MANPLYKSMNNNNQFVQQFNQFRNSFKGDPKQQIQELLNSGKITQAQYDRAVQMAKAFQNMLGFK